MLLLQDVDWHSWTCVSGWPILGIWSRTHPEIILNSVDRTISGKKSTFGLQISFFSFLIKRKKEEKNI